LIDLRSKAVQPMWNQVSNQVSDQVKHQLDIRVWVSTLFFLHRRVASQIEDSL